MSNASAHQREILDAIRRILRAIRVSSRQAEQAIGVSGAQLLVLQTLGTAKKLSIGELAERTHTHQSSVSVVVAKLEAAGLVARTPSSEDARRVEVSLSGSAEKLLRKGTALPQKRLFGAIEEMSATDRAKLASLLTQLVELAGLSDEPATMFGEEEKDEKDSFRGR